MEGIEKLMVPEVVGTEKSRYLWEGMRHHVLNNLMAIVCIVFFVVIYVSNGAGIHSSAWSQTGLSISATLGAFFIVRAIYLQTVGYYTFYAPDMKFYQKIKYNPSHPQGLLKIRKTIMWADVEDK